MVDNILPPAVSKLRKNSPTLGASMICTVISMNGARIGIIQTITARQQMEAHGPARWELVECVVEVIGVTMHWIAGPLIVTVLILVIGKTTLVCGWLL